MSKIVIKWFTYISVIIMIMCMYYSLCFASESNENSEAAVKNINVTDFGANGADNEDDTSALAAALAVAKTSEIPIMVYVPAGTYYINGGLSIYSDTSLILDENAAIVGTHLKGAMLIGRHLNEDGSVCDGMEDCTHGGYSQIQNIMVSGGIWDRNDANGDGNNTILVLRHGSNITIQNLICKNASNHFINLSGVQNAVVESVTCENMSTYTGDDLSFWGNNEIGDEMRYAGIEAVHLDYVNEGGEQGVYPDDNTPCRSIIISNCIFKNVYAGVGTHHSAVNERGLDISVVNCQFSNISYHCVNCYDFDGVVLEGNTAEQIGVFVYSIGSVGTISGNIVADTNMNAIYSAENSIITINENTITDSGEAGIRADGSCELTVENNNIVTNGTHGISVSNKTKLNAVSNTISAPNGSGIFADNLCSGIFSNNQIENVQTGINITSGCIECTVENNSISYTVNNGVNVNDGSSVTISENIVTNAGNAGISGTESSNLYVNNNKIVAPNTHGISVSSNTMLEATSNTVSAPDGSGIYLGNSCSGTLNYNQIQNVQTGINIAAGCEDCTIKYNVISDTVHNGIYLNNRTAAVIDSNTFLNVGAAGIRGDGGCGLTVSNNEMVQLATHGISIANGTGLTASNNVVSECGGSGFYINGSCSGTLCGNTIQSAGAHGVYIYDASTIVLENNLLQSIGNAGIRANVNCTVTANENTIIETGSHGISIEENSILSARGNIITCPNSIGIYLSRGDNSSITENEINQSGSAGIYVAYTNRCLIDKNKVAESSSHAIIAVGNSITQCTVSITNNTAVTVSNTNYDIRLSTYCKDCIVMDNVIGDRGVSVDATSTCIESNNEKVSDNENISDVLAIIVQPQDVGVNSGNGFVMNIEATGTELSYQWYYKKVSGSVFNAWSGKNRSTLRATANDTYDGMQVYCVVTDGNGDSLTSDIAVITIDSLLSIIKQPEDVTVAAVGDKAMIGVEAKGNGLTYLWYYKNPGGSKFAATSTKTPYYTLEITEIRDGRQMYCVITDQYGNSVTSDIATMSVAKPKELIITKQPADVTVEAVGDKATIGVEAEGDGLMYLWYYKNPGGGKFAATSTKTPYYTLEITEIRDGRQMYCVITDQYGNSVTSDIATMSVAKPKELIITKQPADVTVEAVGDKATIGVEAEGDGLTYLWYYKNPGGSKFAATSTKTPYYTLEITEIRDGRQMYCVITDQYGNSVTSNTARMSVAKPKELIITKQPADVTVEAVGDKATIGVEAEGDGLTYLWYYKNPGGSKFAATSTKTSYYTLEITEIRDGRQMYCVITDQYGNSVTSNTATMSVAKTDGIIITKQPQDVIVAEGEKLSFSIGASGNNLTYQWYYKKTTGKTFSKWAGKTSASFSAGSNATYNGMQVYCMVIDEQGNNACSEIVVINIINLSESGIDGQTMDLFDDSSATGDLFSDGTQNINIFTGES